MLSALARGVVLKLTLLALAALVAWPVHEGMYISFGSHSPWAMPPGPSAVEALFDRPCHVPTFRIYYQIPSVPIDDESGR